MTNRRHFMAALAAAFAMRDAPAAGGPEITVYKNEGCGCCLAWIKHLQKDGFTVRAHDVADTALYRAKSGIPEKLGACHTATVGGYAIEGHVPAREIRKLLAERPKARGLAVPGMPAGSPGMESERPQPYEVLLVKVDGTTAVFKSYR